MNFPLFGVRLLGSRAPGRPMPGQLRPLWGLVPSAGQHLRALPPPVLNKQPFSRRTRAFLPSSLSLCMRALRNAPPRPPVLAGMRPASRTPAPQYARAAPCWPGPAVCRPQGRGGALPRRDPQVCIPLQPLPAPADLDPHLPPWPLSTHHPLVSMETGSPGPASYPSGAC